jgi:hypothetical protein
MWRPFVPPGDFSVTMILNGIAEQEFASRRAVDRTIVRHFYAPFEIEDRTVAYFAAERYAAALRLSQLMQEPGPFCNRNCSLDEKLHWLLIETWQTHGLQLWSEAMTTHSCGLLKGIWVERRDPSAAFPKADDIWINDAGVNADPKTSCTASAESLQVDCKENFGAGSEP